MASACSLLFRKKVEVVNLVRVSGQSRREARDLGVLKDAPHNWVKQTSIDVGLGCSEN